MTDTEKLLLSDIKRNYEKKILGKAGKVKAENSFELFVYDQLNSFKDYEKKVYNEVNEIYEKLGWVKYGYFDTINSFWTIFKCAAKRVMEYDRKDLEEQAFFQDYAYNKNDARKLAQKVLWRFPQLDTLAALTHCAANFMPCMDGKFNSLKYSTSKDHLPVFADRINADEKYEQYKNWLKENIDDLCLGDYYETDGESIKGKPLFKGQSVDRPLPEKEGEIKDCLNEIIIRIIKRAGYMAEKIENRAG